MNTHYQMYETDVSNEMRATQEGRAEEGRQVQEGCEDAGEAQGAEQQPRPGRSRAGAHAAAAAAPALACERGAAGSSANPGWTFTAAIPPVVLPTVSALAHLDDSQATFSAPVASDAFRVLLPPAYSAWNDQRVASSGVLLM